MIYAYLKRIKDIGERKRIIDRLISLRTQLDNEIPQKTASSSLLLATWNIRKFGDNRRNESLLYIAEIISRFDLIAIQEVSPNKKGLEKVMGFLGKNWDYIATDKTEGKGLNECMAFLYDTNKVRFKNMAGEIVLPKEQLIDGRQFSRTPFCVSFQTGWFKFNLSTVHIYYGDSDNNNDRRLNEISSIADLLSKRAKNEKFNYVLLGDFNIPDVDCDYMKTLEKKGFFIPNAIKNHPTDLGKTKHYDQIAFNFKLTDSITVYNENQQKSGAFDFSKSVYRENDWASYIPYIDKKHTENKSEKEIKRYFKTYYRTFEMSDHLPLWVELNADFSQQYLDELKKENPENNLPEIE